MAEASDKDRRDPDDERDEDERDEDERDEDEDAPGKGDEGKGDDDADDEEPAAAKKAPNVPGAATKEAAGSLDEPPKGAVAKKAAEGEARPKKKKKKAAAAEGAPAKPRMVAAQRVAPRQGGALGKSLVLFVIVVGGLAAGFALLGRDDGKGDAPPVPKWTVGQTVDVEITLVPSDSKDLACASQEVLAERHCQFEDKGKTWSKGNDPDEKIFKPYTTTDRVQFLAAGVWSQPALKSKLPTTRFSVKCKYKVDGKLKKPNIRWAQDGQWFERNDDWFAGAVSDCTLVQ
jgi:hypothetical protein